MIPKTRLFTPGPTPLHPAVQEAIARPILHHRTDEFRGVFRESIEGLRSFLKTTDDVLILACSGTGGMEAAVVNTIAPGEPMLALVAGSFGERWVAIGNALGADVKVLEATWGEAVSRRRWRRPSTPIPGSGPSSSSSRSPPPAPATTWRPWPP